MPSLQPSQSEIKVKGYDLAFGRKLTTVPTRTSVVGAAEVVGPILFYPVGEFVKRGA